MAIYIKTTCLNHMPQNYYDYHLTGEIGGFKWSLQARFLLAVNSHPNNFCIARHKITQCRMFRKRRICASSFRLGRYRATSLCIEDIFLLSAFVILQGFVSQTEHLEQFNSRCCLFHHSQREIGEMALKHVIFEPVLFLSKLFGTQNTE